MEAVAHRIRSLRWGAHARSQPEAFAVRKWLLDELHSTLLPAFERSFDDAVSRDEVLHIPQLDLHLEITAVDEIKDLLPDLIRRRLAELLRSTAAGATPAQQPGRTMVKGSVGETLTFQLATAGEDRFQALARYLATGSIPWSFASSDRTVILEQLRSAAAAGELAEILAVWTENAGRQVHFEERLASYFRLLQLFPEDQWAVLARTSAKGLAPERRDELAGVIATLTRDRIEGISHYQRLWVTAVVLATMHAVAADAEESAAALDLQQELVANEDLFASPAATAAALLRRLEIESESDSVRSSRSESERIETSARSRSDEKASPPKQERRSGGARKTLPQSTSEAVTEEPARGSSSSLRPKRRPPEGGRKTARKSAAPGEATAGSVGGAGLSLRSPTGEPSQSFDADAGSEVPSHGAPSLARPQRHSAGDERKTARDLASDRAAVEDVKVPGRVKRSAAQEASRSFGDDAGSEKAGPGVSPSARPQRRSAAGGQKASRDLPASDGTAAEGNRDPVVIVDGMKVPDRAKRSAAQESSQPLGDDARSEEPRPRISSSMRPKKRSATGQPERVPYPTLPGNTPVMGSEIPEPTERRSSGSGRKTFHKPAAPQDAPIATGEMPGTSRLPADEPESRSVDESVRRQGFSAAAEARSARPADTEQRIQSPGVSVFPLVVTQAGLVLLHPFLSRFFENLGIKDAKQTVLPAASLPRAAALLHWLATGDEEVYEFELGFIKILLGLPPGFTLPVASGLLHESDKEEADALLQAVLEHWTALKSTSAAALRQSFLRRRGLVREEEQGFRLQVEPEPFDVLLGTLPWGLGTVKLSWMKKPIFTDWPTL